MNLLVTASTQHKNEHKKEQKILLETFIKVLGSDQSVADSWPNLSDSCLLVISPLTAAIDVVTIKCD